jgi:transposase
MICKRCNSDKILKNGKRDKKQCYICKECRHQFLTDKPRHSQQEESLAILLYCTGLSFRAIARILKYNPSTIMRWIHKYSNKNFKKPTPTGELVIELDEMWHFLQSKKTSFGYGRLIAEIQNSLLTGS